MEVAPSTIEGNQEMLDWASCSTAGWVSFSDELLTQTPDFQDYVIAHELLHLKVPNHSKLFKSLLSAHFPRWKKFDLQR